MLDDAVYGEVYVIAVRASCVCVNVAAGVLGVKLPAALGHRGAVMFWCGHVLMRRRAQQQPASATLARNRRDLSRGLADRRLHFTCESVREMRTVIID